MLDQLLVLATRGLLWLRYRITVRGLDRIAPRDERGMLILPNHPALIDPVILMSVLWPRFRPRVLADRAQVDRPGLRLLMRRVRALEMADMTRDGRAASDQVEAVVQACAAASRAGDALLLYPAGRLYRQRFEDLGGNSAVEQLLRAVPDVRVVLVRTSGLWGSSFSRASGEAARDAAGPAPRPVGPASRAASSWPLGARWPSRSWSPRTCRAPPTAW